MRKVFITIALVACVLSMTACTSMSGLMQQDAADDGQAASGILMGAFNGH